MAIAILCIALPKYAYGQWSFRESVHISGRCDGVDRAIVNAINNQIPEATGFATRAECEAARAYINSIRASYGGCTSYASASPCVGHDIGGGSVAGIANPTIGASAQGSSFFYTSVPEEVKNWQAEQDRIDAIIGNRSDNPVIGLASTSDGSFNASLNNDISRLSFGSAPVVNIGNGVFTGIPATQLQPVSLDADMTKVNGLIDSIDSDFYKLLLEEPNLFYTAVKEKFDELRKGAQYTNDDYNAFVESVYNKAVSLADKSCIDATTVKEKKEIDMAILAAICYGDDSNGYEQLTGYKSISLSEVPNELQNLASAIELCNNTESDTGFHTELYYNETTGAYTIAFQGSNDIKDWLYNNAVNGLNMEVPQFNLVRGLASAVNGLDSNIEINLVGHSLGGALAGYMGLLTGKETFTYNAEGLSPDIINSIPNYDDSKIQAYHSSYEVLSMAQHISALKVPGQEIVLENRSLGDLAADLAGDALTIANKINPISGIASKVVGAEDNRSILDSHSMKLVVDHLLEINEPAQTEWQLSRQRSASVHSFPIHNLMQRNSLDIIVY